MRLHAFEGAKGTFEAVFDRQAGKLEILIFLVKIPESRVRLQAECCLTPLSVISGIVWDYAGFGD